MKKSLALHAAALLLLLCPVATGESYLDHLLKLRGTESAVELRGRLVDQDGEPVSGAVVRYETERYGLLEPIYGAGSVKSDGDGLFEIRGGRAGVLYIEDIVAGGYEFCSFGNGDKTRFEFRSSRRDRHRPGEGEPVLFHLRRRRARPTFLLKKNFPFGFAAGPGGRPWARDMAKGWVRRPGLEYEDVFWDMEATGSVDAERGEWRLSIRTNGENSGIQLLDKLLYEAPEGGYEKSLDVVIPFSKDLRSLHFYARLREPGMYTRIDMDNYSHADEKEICLYLDVLINPYGDRSFEELIHDPHVRDKRFSQCDDEAYKAFRKQRLAPRPPFEEWIRKGLVRY